MRLQARLAEEHSARLSRMQVDMPTAAYGDPTREWTHLPLSQACRALPVTAGYAGVAPLLHCLPLP